MPIANTGIVAAGTTQGTGTVISECSLINQIGTCTSAAGAVVLPVSPVLNTEYLFRNDGVANCLLFPPSGAAINSLAANANVYIAPKGQMSLVATSATQWYVIRQSGPRPSRVLASGNNTLTAEDSDQVFYVTQAAAGTITLPAPTTPSLKYTFVLQSAASHTVAITGGASLLYGMWSCVLASTNAGAVATASTNANFLTGAAAVGDTWILISDGTKYSCQGVTGVNNGLSFS